jgi:hypothetical protein
VGQPHGSTLVTIQVTINDLRELHDLLDGAGPFSGHFTSRPYLRRRLAAEIRKPR